MSDAGCTRATARRARCPLSCCKSAQAGRQDELWTSNLEGGIRLYTSAVDSTDNCSVAVLLGGDGVMNITVEVDECGMNRVPILTLLPSYPGCVHVSVTGGIVKQEQDTPAPGAAKIASASARGPAVNQSTQTVSFTHTVSLDKETAAPATVPAAGPAAVPAGAPELRAHWHSARVRASRCAHRGRDARRRRGTSTAGAYRSLIGLGLRIEPQDHRPGRALLALFGQNVNQRTVPRPCRHADHFADGRSTLPMGGPLCRHAVQFADTRISLAMGGFAWGAEGLDTIAMLSLAGTS